MSGRKEKGNGLYGALIGYRNNSDIGLLLYKDLGAWVQNANQLRTHNFFFPTFSWYCESGSFGPNIKAMAFAVSFWRFFHVFLIGKKPSLARLFFIKKPFSFLFLFWENEISFKEFSFTYIWLLHSLTLDMVAHGPGQGMLNPMTPALGWI